MGGNCKHCRDGFFDGRFGQDVECVNGVLIDIDEAHEGGPDGTLTLKLGKTTASSASTRGEAPPRLPTQERVMNPLIKRGRAMGRWIG
jgi:hypothetical protein